MILRTEQVGKTFDVSFPDTGAHIGFSRITDLHSGDYRGWVSLCDGDVLLHGSAINLCTASARQSLLKSLNGHSGTLPWSGMLDMACIEVIKRLMAGSPAEVIRSEETVPAEQYLIEPFVPLNEPTLLFGRGGSCKSYLALLFAVFVQLPWPANPFGWKVDSKSTNVLYLDWETSRNVIHRRLKRLLSGMGAPPALHIIYRQCRGTLVSELEAIEKTVMDHQIGFVIIDSAGRGCGGDLNAPAPVNEFYTAARQLGKSPLIIHHSAKDEFRKEKTPFGSTYFENNARSQWYVEREREGNETDFVISLSHTKVNDSAKRRSIGLRVKFDNTPGQETTRFELCDLKQTEFADKLPLKDRLAVLLQDGPLPIDKIAAQLGATEATVRTRLYENQNLFAKRQDKTWELKKNDVP